MNALPTRLRLCPTGKWVYATEDAARVALERWQHPNILHYGTRRPVRCYRCPDCGAWHLTSRPERDTP
jgi:hypothetical protein